MSRIWTDGAKDKYGAEVKENKLKQQAIAEKERRRHLAVGIKAPSLRHH